MQVCNTIGIVEEHVVADVYWPVGRRGMCEGTRYVGGTGSGGRTPDRVVVDLQGAGA